MGIRMQNNFKKRFGDRPFKVVYPEKRLTGDERKLRNEKLSEAVKAVLTGILKREPTPEELYGFEDISKKGSFVKNLNIFWDSTARSADVFLV